MNWHFRKSAKTRQDLSSITDIKDEQQPSAGGMTQNQANQIWRAIEFLYRSGEHPQISFCLRRHGKIILNRSIGYAKGNGPNQHQIEKMAAKTTTPICLFSASKLITSILIHILAEENKLALCDLVTKYIPEYGQLGKQDTTIENLLVHQGGIPQIKNKDPNLLFDKDAALKAIYQTKAKHTPGQSTAYHALTSGYVLTEIIERICDMPLTEFLQQKIATPMQMRCFNYGLEKRFRGEVATNYSSGLNPIFGTNQYLKHVLGTDLDTAVNLTNDSRFMDTICPSANIYSSAEEVGRFCEMLLNGGKYNQHQILKAETIRHLTRAISPPQFDRTLLIPMRYALGPMLGGEPFGLFGRHTKFAFGHMGFSNNFCWADPERDISVSLLSTGKSVVGRHIPALLNVLHQISTQCPRLPKQQRRGLFSQSRRQSDVQ